MENCSNYSEASKSQGTVYWAHFHSLFTSDSCEPYSLEILCPYPLVILQAAQYVFPRLTAQFWFSVCVCVRACARMCFHWHAYVRVGKAYWLKRLQPEASTDTYRHCHCLGVQRPARLHNNVSCSQPWKLLQNLQLSISVQLQDKRFSLQSSTQFMIFWERRKSIMEHSLTSLKTKEEY